MLCFIEEYCIIVASSEPAMMGIHITSPLLVTVSQNLRSVYTLGHLKPASVYWTEVGE